MKRPTSLLSRILVELGLQARLTVERDCEEMRSRFKHEGWSFLTITLPSLCDALEKGITLGRIAPTMFPGFKPYKRGGKLPALLSGFFMRVFERDGSLRNDPCIEAIAAIRQVTRLFKKVERTCSAARVSQAYERYVQNDEELFEPGSRPTRGDFLLRYVSGCLWSDLELLSGELYCSPGKFGTGATAERTLYNARHSISEWPVRGDNSFPASYHCLSREDDVEVLSSISFLEEQDERPVRVVDVPKTLKAPRVISVEPSYMMLRQQSICLRLMDWLENGVLGFNSIRFTDQTVNRELARIGSIDGLLATIDLKDASDRVSLALVEDIFESCPTFLNFLLDSRSRRAELPDGQVRTLKRFASMGSALCFPVEAMVFLTLAVTALAEQFGVRPSPTKIRSIANTIAVYGDDIIVSSEMVPAVVGKLEAYRLKVNQDKSFSQGFFRESCGGDYYRGHDVTPVYVRRWDESGKRLHGNELASYVSLSNQFYMKGLWHVSQAIRDHVRRSGSGDLPRTTHQVGVLTYCSVYFNTQLRWDVHQCGWRVRGPKLTPRRQLDRVSDIRGAMLLSFGGKRDETTGSLGRDYATAILGRAKSLFRDQQEELLASGDHRKKRSTGTRNDSSTGRDDPCGSRVPWTFDRRSISSILDPYQPPIEVDTSVKSQSLKTKTGWAAVRP